MSQDRATSHDRQWAATHEALQDAALARFRRDGFEATSVSDIAADAGVSERTFYRHYATKEAVLFSDQRTRLEWLQRALELRRDDEPIFDAVMVAMRSFPGDREVVREAAMLRHKLIGHEQTVDALLAIQADFASAITHYAARRLAGHPHSELLAKVTGASIAAALLAAFDHWGQHGAVDDIGEIDEIALGFLRSGLALDSPRTSQAAP